MELSPRELAQFARERDDYSRLLDRIRKPGGKQSTEGIEIVCIGNTGGGDNVVHGRPSGGFLVRHKARTMIVDPGDNSIAYLTALGFNPYNISDVLASHAHNDHVGDLTLAVSAAIKLGLPKQDDHRIIVSPSLIDYGGSSSTKFGFTLPAYAWLSRVEPLYYRDVTFRRFDGAEIKSARTADIPGDIRVSAAEARHGEIMVTGFVIDTAAGRLAYTSDTEYFPGLAKWYEDTDLLWMNMNTLSLNSMDDGDAQTPTDALAPTHTHLGYIGVCRLIEELRPTTAVISHFGAQIVGQRENIEAMLRERFASAGVTIHCPKNGDSYFFEQKLSSPPVVRRFEP